PGFPQEGRRARTLCALGQLSQERQYRLYRRPRAEERSGNAAHAEFRPQVAQRDQGSAGTDGPASRHGSARLAAREHRGARQALRGSLLSLEASWPGPSRPSTSWVNKRKSWMPGTRPGVTNERTEE